MYVKEARLQVIFLIAQQMWANLFVYKGEVKSKGFAPVVPRQRKECEIKSLQDTERYQKDKRGRYEIIF